MCRRKKGYEFFYGSGFSGLKRELKNLTADFPA
jgi:hypothetical protein